MTDKSQMRGGESEGREGGSAAGAADGGCNHKASGNGAGNQGCRGNLAVLIKWSSVGPCQPPGGGGRQGGREEEGEEQRRGGERKGYEDECTNPISLEWLENIYLSRFLSLFLLY